MSIFLLIFILALIASAAYGAIRLFSLAGTTAAKIIWAVAILAMVLIALQAFGVRLPNPAVPRVSQGLTSDFIRNV